MFITIEGIDGAGKTLQTNLLSKYLKEKKLDCLVLREPGGTRFSEKIRDILLDKNNSISDVTEFLLFAASRAELFKKVIEPNIKLGKIILCDRFVDSTIAYQGFARGIDLKFIENVNSYITKMPDLTLYLDIDVDIAYNRLVKNNSSFDRLEKEGKIFQKKVREGYLFLVKKYKRIKLIDTNFLTIDEVNKKILDLVDDFISQYKNY